MKDIIGTNWIDCYYAGELNEKENFKKWYLSLSEQERKELWTFIEQEALKAMNNDIDCFTSIKDITFGVPIEKMDFKRQILGKIIK